MAHLDFPFGKTALGLDIADTRLRAVLTSGLHAYTPEADGETLVRRAMADPIGTKPLAELARGKQRVVIIASDHTRPVPSKVIIPQMLAEVRRGNPAADITILIATGCHRETTRDELVAKFGEDIVQNEKIYVHDCDDAAMLTDIGVLPSGVPPRRICCSPKGSSSRTFLPVIRAGARACSPGSARARPCLPITAPSSLTAPLHAQA